MCVDIITAGHVRVRMPHDWELVGGIPAIGAYEYECRTCGKQRTS